MAIEKLPLSLFLKEGGRWKQSAKTSSFAVPLFAKEGVGGKSLDPVKFGEVRGYDE
jgi:hypothetical protein